MLLENIEQLNDDIEEAKAQLQHDQTIQEIQNDAILALEQKLHVMEKKLATGENKNLSAAQCESIANGSIKFHLGESLQIEDRILSTTVVNLSTTCSMLSVQVKQLQDSMRQLVHGLSYFCNQSHKKIEQILIKTCTTNNCIKISRSTQTASVTKPMSPTGAKAKISKPMSKTVKTQEVSKPMSKSVSVDETNIEPTKKKTSNSKLHKSKPSNSSKQSSRC